MPLEIWDTIVPLLTRPWLPEWACHDLRYWSWAVDETPSRAILAKRWGWTEKRVRYLTSTPNLWVKPERGQVGAEQGPNRGRTETGQPGESSGKGPNRGRTGAEQGPEPLDSEGESPLLSELRIEEEVEEQECVPGWLRKPKGMTITRRELYQALAGCLEVVRQTLVVPTRTSVAPVLALMRAVGVTDRDSLSVFLGDWMLVARAARECPHGLFSRDLRAEDWPEGFDRSRSVATLAVQMRWDDRLVAAKEWVGGPASKPRWEFDPDG